MPYRKMRERPTGDLIVIFLTLIVGLVVVLITATMLIVESRSNGKADTTVALETVRAITGSLLAAIVGYIAGRGAPMMDRSQRDQWNEWLHHYPPTQYGPQDHYPMDRPPEEYPPKEGPDGRRF